MNETGRLLERVGERFPFPDQAFEGLRRRRDRKRRNERIAAGALALALTAAGVFGLVRSLAWRPAEPANGASTIVDEIPIPGAGAVTVGAGATVSITKVLVALPLLPAPSPWITWAVYWALAVNAEGVVDQVPLLTATLLIVCSSVPLVFGPA